MNIIKRIIAGLRHRFILPSHIVSHRRVDGEHEFTFSNGRVVRGDCTVWNFYPSGARCGLELQRFLHQEWKAAKWKKNAEAGLGEK